jgi:hypothetical protein
MGRFVDGVEWRVREAERLNQEELARTRRLERGPWWRRLDAHDVGGLIAYIVILGPLAFFLLRALFT